LRDREENFGFLDTPSLDFLQHHVPHPSRYGDEDLVRVLVQHEGLHRSDWEWDVVSSSNHDSSFSFRGRGNRSTVRVTAKPEPKVEVLAEHQILWPTSKLALRVGHESPTIHALESLDLPGDELRLQLLLQRSLHDVRNGRHVRVDELSSRERNAYSGIEVSIEAILDHRTGGSAFSAVDSQPEVNYLVFWQVRESDTANGLPQKSGENLERSDFLGGRGRIDRIFYLGEFMSCRVDVNEISWFWERERGRLVRREDGDTGDRVQEWERGYGGGWSVEVLEWIACPSFWNR